MLDLTKPISIFYNGMSRSVRLICSDRQAGDSTYNYVGLIDMGSGCEETVVFDRNGFSNKSGQPKIYNLVERKSFFQNCYGDLMRCSRVIWKTREAADQVEFPRYDIRAVIEYVMEDDNCVDIILHKTWEAKS